MGAVVSVALDRPHHPARRGRRHRHRRARDRRDAGARAQGGGRAADRPGAGGSLGTDQLAKAAKDGYTIGLPNNAALVFRALVDPAGTNYDAFKDLAPLGLAMRSPSIIAAGADAPFRNFREMIEYAKNNPGKVRIGTAGAGSVGDFCIQTINFLTGAGLTSVPFKGATPAITAVRGGHIEAVVLALGALRTHIESGALRGIVISSKWKDLPGIPTMQELGFKDPLFGIWTAFFAPAGVPDEVSRGPRAGDPTRRQHAGDERADRSNSASGPEYLPPPTSSSQRWRTSTTACSRSARRPASSNN